MYYIEFFPSVERIDFVLPSCARALTSQPAVIRVIIHLLRPLVCAYHLSPCPPSWNEMFPRQMHVSHVDPSPVRSRQHHYERNLISLLQSAVRGVREAYVRHIDDEHNDRSGKAIISFLAPELDCSVVSHSFMESNLADMVGASITAFVLWFHYGLDVKRRRG